jgi:hypothetical protein
MSDLKHNQFRLSAKINFGLINSQNLQAEGRFGKPGGKNANLQNQSQILF